MTTKPAPQQPSISDAPNLYEDGIFYPEEDGIPLPDAETQGRVFQELVPTLRAHHSSQPRTRVNGNTFIYYERGNPQRSISPDCYVAFDVDVDTIIYHNTYRIWAVGKPPDFALEIASESMAERDLTEKRDLYAQIGIGEYWRYDPTADSRHYGEKLVGEHLVNDEYQRLPVAPDAEGRPRGHSPTLGLDLVWDDGRLRFYDPATNEWLKSFDEERAARETERAARETAEARAESAEAEIQRLREQLRRLQEPQ